MNDWDTHLGWIRFAHLSECEIKDLVNHGWEMGSHGKTHRCLTGFSRLEIKKELSDSKQILEAMLKCQVNYFSSPFGKINSRILEETLCAGYKGICGFFPFRYLEGRRSVSEIPRLAVYLTDSLKSIERKLSYRRGLRREVLKQNLINFCSNATVMLNSLR